MEQENKFTEEQVKDNQKLMKKSQFMIISFFLLFAINLIFIIILQTQKLYVFRFANSSFLSDKTDISQIFALIFYIIIMISFIFYLYFALAYRKRKQLDIEAQMEGYKSYAKAFDWADVFGIVPIFLIIVSIVNGFFFSLATVSQESMEPTFCSGDAVIIQYADTFNDGEYVIAYANTYPEPENVIKKVVAVPGDSFRADGTGVYVNGELIEPNAKSFRTEGTITVPEGEYFLLGDNRGPSVDSRVFGFVPQKDMLGLVVFRLSNRTCPVGVD